MNTQNLAIGCDCEELQSNTRVAPRRYAVDEFSHGFIVKRRPHPIEKEALPNGLLNWHTNIRAVEDDPSKCRVRHGFSSLTTIITQQRSIWSISTDLSRELQPNSWPIGLHLSGIANMSIATAAQKYSAAPTKYTTGYFGALQRASIGSFIPLGNGRCPRWIQRY